MNKHILFLVLIVFSASLLANDIVITVDGKKHASINLEEIRKLKSNTINFFNHNSKRAELYQGVPTMTFIEKFYPESQSLIEVEFISENDFKSFATIEQLQKVHSILAYDRADGDKFVRYSQKEKILVPLGPLYLVWDLKGMNYEERLIYSSIYQIKSINLVTNKSDFGLKENTVDNSVYLGYQTYKKQCMSCHALGNVGGNVSFDLMKRKTLETKGAEYVKKYVLNPHEMNPKTKMLPLPKFKNRDEMAQGLVDFLKFMQNPEELLKKKKAAESDTSYKVLRDLVDHVHK